MDKYKNVLSDNRLSFGAKGLYIYLRETSPNGDFAQKNIKDVSNNGSTEIKKYMRELMAMNYIVRNVVREKGIIQGINYIYNDIEYDNSLKDGENRVGYVYLVHNSKEYKIGCTLTPYSRLSVLKNKFDAKEIITCEKVKGFRKREDELHEMFREKRTHGEWFDLNDDDINAILEYLEKHKI